MSVEGVTKDNFIQYQYRSDGVKLGQKVYTNGAASTTRDYCGRFVYENQELSYIIFSEGTIRVSKINPGDPNNPEFIAPIMTRSGTQQYGLTREFHLKDHLGNVRVVFNTSGILSENHYYPFGLPIHNLSISTAPAGKENRYLYNGKELQDDLGLNWMDYGARFYDAGLGRWHSVDPLAEKYYNHSPYHLSGNNPIRFIDLDGMSYSEFDENGNYLQTTKDNWWHNFWHGRTGRIVDSDGNIIQSFKFADPKNDVKDLKKGTINRIHFVQESEIESMLSKSGAFNHENKVENSESRYGYILKEGESGGKFDFAFTGIPDQYPDRNPSKSLYLVDGVAHNRFNFGNFLFGAAGRAIGLTLFELRMGAHYNSVFNPDKNGYRSQLDSRDDQFSIRMGVRYANNRGYRNMQYRIIVGPLQNMGYID